jgi:hypothetical protein
MARLDRLGPAKEVAQIGPAIEREFSHPLPQAGSGAHIGARPSLCGWFAVPAGCVAIRAFKHALAQDAAYGTLLPEPGRALHARITEIVERHFAEIAETQPELMAPHCTEPGLIEHAAGLWGKAGQRSLVRSRW